MMEVRQAHRDGPEFDAFERIGNSVVFIGATDAIQDGRVMLERGVSFGQKGVAPTLRCAQRSDIVRINGLLDPFVEFVRLRIVLLCYK